MIEIVADFVLAGIGLSILLSAIRIFLGPTLPDRVVALDNIATNNVAVIVVLSLRSGSEVYIDAALVIAILSFLGTVAISKYLMRRSVIDGADD